MHASTDGFAAGTTKNRKFFFMIAVDECERIFHPMKCIAMTIMLKLFFSYFSSPENTLKIEGGKICFARRKKKMPIFLQIGEESTRGNI